MGNCVSPPAPPSIPPDHPFLSGHAHSSQPVPFGFQGKPPCRVPDSSSRPFPFEMDAGTRRDLQGWVCPGKSFEKFPATATLPDAWQTGDERPKLPD